MTRRRSIAAILVTLATVEAIIVLLLILPALSDDPPATIQAPTASNEVRNPTDTPVPRSERLAPYPPTPSIPPDAPPCTPDDLSGHVPVKPSKFLLGSWATRIYLVNESPEVCVIEGRPVLTGIAADGSQVALTNIFSCPGSESRCARFVVDEPIALYPKSVTEPGRPHAASIEIVARGPLAGFCDDPIPSFPGIRVSWPQGEIDIQQERHFVPCEAEIYVYWFQPGDLPYSLQDQ